MSKIAGSLLGCGPYLPENAEEKLRAYVYRGTDKSLLYKYIWRPLCLKIVNYLPNWLAANVISVGALVLVIISHIILAFYMPKLMVENSHVNFNHVNENNNIIITDTNIYSEEQNEQQPSSFIFIISGFALLAYPILDNLDGLQARRTGTASPLGLIVDHGCDAFNCIIGALSVASSASTGPIWKSWIFLLSTLTPFFMNTWEEYYTGELILPIINGANEGVFLAILLFFITAFVGGPQFWENNGIIFSSSWLPEVLAQSPQLAAVAIESKVLQTICPLISSNNNNNIIGITVSTIPVLLGLNCSDAYMTNPPLPIRKTNNYIGHNLIQNFIIGFYDQNDSSNIKISYNTIIAVTFGVSAFFTCIGNIIHVYYAVHQFNNFKNNNKNNSLKGKIAFLKALTQLLPISILTLFATLWSLSSPSNIFFKYPRIFCWTFGLHFTISSIHLMIAHVCNVKFFSFRRPLWPFFFIGTYIIILFFNNTILWFNFYKNQNLSKEFIFTNSVWNYLFDEKYILWGLFITSVVTFVHLAYNVIWEVATALKVPIFTIPIKNQKEMQNKEK